MCWGSNLGTVINLNACFRLYDAPNQEWNPSSCFPPPKLCLVFKCLYFSLFNFHFWVFAGWRLGPPGILGHALGKIQDYLPQVLGGESVIPSLNS